MAMIRKCCFCWNTKQGSIASGIYTMIGRVISVIVIIIFLAKKSLLKSKLSEWGLTKDDLPAVRGVLIASLVGCLIFIMFCIFVVYGAIKDRRGFLLPWVIVMSIEVAIQIIFLFAIIVVVATRKGTKDIISGVIVILTLIFSTMFQIYCIICVHSHYQFLGQTSSNPPSYAVKM